MKKTITIILCFFLLCWGSSSLSAQSGIVATGGNSAASTGSVSYSAGQVDFVSSKPSGRRAGGINVNPGNQQPFEIFILTGMDEKGIILSSFSANIYPNPTEEYVTLKIENAQIENLRVELFDLAGKVIVNRNLDSKETLIPMQDLANATYFIKVFSSNTCIKTFKIIKKL